MLITPYTNRFHADTLANGGATVDLDQHDLRQPEGRFYVGAGSRTWVHRIQVKDFSPVFLAMLVAVAKSEGFRALGTWVRGDGYVLIEPTEVYTERQYARQAAEEYGEQAYYDTVLGTIYL